MSTDMTPSNPGFLPMEVAQTSFLVDRLGQDCEPAQFLRELTQNSIEAIARSREPGEVRWQTVQFNFPSGKSGIKLSITDSGVGMTGEEMERHINQLSASGSQQSMQGNFGVGAKITIAPRNPLGVIFRSWKGGVGHEVLLCRDPATGRYGLRQYAIGNDEYAYHRQVSDDLKPSEIGAHGTQVILLGKSEEEDTSRPPADIDPTATWISKYLNSRYFRFPHGVTVAVDELPIDMSSASSLCTRVLTGQESYLEAHSINSGTMTITGATVRWWILEDSPSLTADATFIESAGHVAAFYQNELYELRNGRAGNGKLQQFGITFGFRRVVIYVEPRSGKDRLITSNTARNQLLLGNLSLPWETWAADFRRKMPVALRKFIEEQGAKASHTDHSKTVRRRLDKIIDLFKPLRRRVKGSGKKAEGQKGGRTATETRAGEGAKKTKEKGSRNGKKGRSGSKSSQNHGWQAGKTMRDVFPRTVWISVADATRERTFLEDRAATYLPDQHLLQINRDSWVFNDLIDHCSKGLADHPGAKKVVAEAAHAWFEQVLVEATIGVGALQNRKEWSGRDIESALSPEALTAVVMPRYQLIRSVMDDLHRKLPRAAATGPRTRGRRVSDGKPDVGESPSVRQDAARAGSVVQATAPVSLPA